MRWGEQGGQAILSFRALVQSNRLAWTLLAHTYKAEVTALDQLAMIGVSMRVTPIPLGVDPTFIIVSVTYRHTITGM